MSTSRLSLRRSAFLAAFVYSTLLGVSLWMQWDLLSPADNRRDLRPFMARNQPSNSYPNARKKMDTSTNIPDWKLQLGGTMIRTFWPTDNNETARQHHHHDPTKQRVCLALTATPSEMDQLQQIIERVWRVPRYANLFDCIHLSIPDRPIRVAAPKVSLSAAPLSGQQNKQKTASSSHIQNSKLSYPNTTTLQSMFPDPRIILHRLPDFGPMTRYLGPLAFEQHPDTALLVMDMDSPRLLSSSSSTTNNDLVSLVRAASRANDAVFCHSGENFLVNQFGQVQPTWENSVWGNDEKEATTEHYSHYFTRVHLCRAAGGMLVKPKHFADMWYNQSDYHESCFWDDDRWLAFQFERQGFPLYKPTSATEDINLPSDTGIQGVRESAATILKQGGNDGKKILRRRLGSLSTVNRQLQSAVTCTVAWMNRHPMSFPSARVTTDQPWDRTRASRQNGKGGDNDDDEFIAQLEQDLEDSVASVQQKYKYQHMLEQYRGSKV